MFHVKHAAGWLDLGPVNSVVVDADVVPEGLVIARIPPAGRGVKQAGQLQRAGLDVLRWRTLAKATSLRG
jgi:hypothetical protein